MDTQQEGTGRPKRGVSNPDYVNVFIPNESADRTLFSSTQRRAEILSQILETGSMREPFRGAAKKYGVSHMQISKDKDILEKYIARELITSDRVISDVFTSKQKAREASAKKGDWRTVNQITDSELDMAYNIGVVSKTPERHEIDVREVASKLLGEWEARSTKKKVAITNDVVGALMAAEDRREGVENVKSAVLLKKEIKEIAKERSESEGEK